MPFLRSILFLTGVAAAAGAHADCMSHSTLIPRGKTVCFAHSMLQYNCTRIRGEVGLSYIQRLSMRSSLKDRSICYHVDATNDRPARSQIID